MNAPSEGGRGAEEHGIAIDALIDQVMNDSGGRYRVGVDIGGPFTDLALVDGDGGRLTITKVLTDHGDVSRGVMTGLRIILAQGMSGRRW